MGGRGDDPCPPPPKIFSEGDVPPKIPRRKKNNTELKEQERKIKKSSKIVQMHAGNKWAKTDELSRVVTPQIFRPRPGQNFRASARRH